MTETPPHFGSKRFRDILWPALRGDPAAALAGLYWFVTRRRVRGWGILLAAATQGPNSYEAWTRGGELQAFAKFRESHPYPEAVPAIVALIIADEGARDAAERSAQSIQCSFGGDACIYATVANVPHCRTLPGTPTHLASALATIGDHQEAEWIVPVLAGDRVSRELRDVLRRSLADARGAIAYWDEDHVGPMGRVDPWIKPDWDDILFSQLGGLAGASIMRLAAARKIADSMPAVSLDRSGVERLAMALATDGSGGSPFHIPLVLTHRCGCAELRNPPAFPIAGMPTDFTWPSVSILVPTRDRPDLLAACVRGIECTSYRGAIELVIIDNGSVDPSALRIMGDVESKGAAKILRDERPFNFSRLNNRASEIAQGEFLCFLNNDVEPLTDDWLSLMISCALGERVGAVGALLLYPSGRIQHAGVAIGLGGAAGHVQKGVDPADRRMWTWHRVTREVSAVTAAAMVVRKTAFLDVGGFDEEAFPVAFNDVDLCMKLKAAGLRNVFVAEARLLHRESESRGDDRSSAHAARFAVELRNLQERWITSGFVDPHFSPLFSRAVERCVLAP